MMMFLSFGDWIRRKIVASKHRRWSIANCWLSSAFRLLSSSRLIWLAKYTKAPRLKRVRECVVSKYHAVARLNDNKVKRAPERRFCDQLNFSIIDSVILSHAKLFHRINFNWKSVANRNLFPVEIALIWCRRIKAHEIGSVNCYNWCWARASGTVINVWSLRFERNARGFEGNCGHSGATCFLEVIWMKNVQNFSVFGQNYKNIENLQSSLIT